MNIIVQKIVRHLLTAVGGGVMATDEVVNQIVCALSFFAGLAWSIYETRQKPTQPPTIRPILSVLIAGVLLSGCAQIEPGHDPLIVRAEQAYRITFEAVDALLKIEERNRDLIWQTAPEVSRATDEIRNRYPAVRQTFRKALAAYRQQRTALNASALNASISALGLESDVALDGARKLQEAGVQ